MQGDITRSFPLDFESWCERYGEGRVSISWFDLQTSLRSLLSPDIVQANHRCVHVEEETGWVRIDSISDTTISSNPYAHWEMMQSTVDPSASTQDAQDSDHQSFFAKLVVAADGINSTIRQVLYDHQGLKEWGKPQYSGFAGISSRIANVPTAVIEELDTKYIQGGRITSIYNDSENLLNPDFRLLRVLLIRLPDNTVSYFLIAPFSSKSWKNKPSNKILDLGMEALKNAEFPPVFTDLISLSNPERLSHRPFYMHPVIPHKEPQPSWSHGRVVLVGDAAHGMPPFLAQGANQGLEDAAVIATAIAKLIRDHGWEQDSAMAEGQLGAIANAFHQYEHLRKPFMEKVQSATMTCSQWTQQQWDDFNEVLHRREYPSSVTLGEFI